ncbi:hypothetical protein E4T56_gene9839 [Termitomyces sp. T112]|nr:hypothetical protein E4T56_gene9839 [Termitomyces sp. T112]
MSLSLRFSSNVLFPFRKSVASDEVTFRHSSSVKIIPPDSVAIADVTEKMNENFRLDEFHYKGRISLPDELSPREVVVRMLVGRSKAVYSETLPRYIHEAKFYQDHLCSNESLYGNGVPKIYGFYETKLTWKAPRRDMLVDCACIVYQYYGSSKNLQWSTGTGVSDFGLRVVKLLFEMHKSGIRHGFLTLKTNIACLDGKPFFTDFSQACTHNCPEKAFELPVRLFDVDADTLKCAELRGLLEELREDVAPFRFHWYGYDVDYDRVDSLDNIFKRKRRTRFRRDSLVEEQWEHAVKVWKFLCANWSSYHEGEAPPVGDTSFEAYKAKYGLNIVYEDEKCEYHDSDDEE